VISSTLGRRVGKGFPWVVISVATLLFVVLPLLGILMLGAWGAE
jgi:hypothetical protein